VLAPVARIFKQEHEFAEVPKRPLTDTHAQTLFDLLFPGSRSYIY